MDDKTLPNEPLSYAKNVQYAAEIWWMQKGLRQVGWGRPLFGGGPTSPPDKWLLNSLFPNVWAHQ